MKRPYAAIDIAFLRHPKVRSLTPEAQVAFLASILHGVEFLTDGFLTPTDGRDIARKQSVVRELEKASLWDPNADGGWLIHDFLKYQRSRAKVVEKSEQNAAAAHARWLAEQASKNGTPLETWIEADA